MEKFNLIVLCCIFIFASTPILTAKVFRQFLRLRFKSQHIRYTRPHKSEPLLLTLSAITSLVCTSTVYYGFFVFTNRWFLNG